MMEIKQNHHFLILPFWMVSEEERLTQTCSVTQSCPTLCDPMDCMQSVRPPRLSASTTGCGPWKKHSLETLSSVFEILTDVKEGMRFF